MFLMALIVLAVDRGKKFNDIVVTNADTGNDFRLIVDDTKMGTKAERKAHIEMLLMKLDTINP